MGAPERCVHGEAAASNNDGVAPVVTDECGEVQRGGTTRRARIKRERERGGGVPADRRMAPDRQRPKTGERERCGAAMLRSRPNRGGGRGLIGGP
jgi:hypothetical protein